ncbi:unnamed protein product [Brassica napus]|uniref:(rape) hypothetical protein n=1 Tax=Brassica napus TaxID=3708 RepID=A0A816JY57_BRANA|nr:unnamed protein product [Brassica napus]
MFPKWEFDAEDTPAENIIKLMFVKRPWNHRYLGQYKAGGCESSEKRGKASESAPAEASEEVHTVARSEVTTTDIIYAMREGFGTCLKEIKHLSKRVEAVEKKVGITTKRKGISSQNTETWTSAQNTIPPPKPTLEPGSESVNGTNAGRKSLPEDKDPDVPADASSSKDKAPEPSLEDARYLEKRDAALALYRAKSD